MSDCSGVVDIIDGARVMMVMVWVVVVMMVVVAIVVASVVAAADVVAAGVEFMLLSGWMLRHVHHV